jgi:CheY-like chemotaxis protein
MQVSEQFGTGVRGSVLLVEDSELERAALSTTLEGLGFAVIACEDSRSALQALESVPTPHLILLDLHTPHMNGWEFCLEQRRHTTWRNIPVIAISGDRSAQAAAIHADGYLPKPLQRGALLRTIDKVLADAREKTAAAQQVHASKQWPSVGREQVSAGDSDEALAQSERGASLPLEVLSSSLLLARTLTESLQSRLPSSERFSAVGIGKVLTRAHKAAMHLRALLHAREVQARALMPRPKREGLN